ncbi:serine/threonine-protein kinase [Sorangium sp. So ce281]|uniref:serine/threonine-protein kinase n=1 Tax=unclassified Sorangium TaxID=2621164 RepID=UPI003F61F647
MDLPGDRFGPYRLLQPIGSGGAGRVFLAVHQHMGQEVALKVLSHESAGDPQLAARFVQESRALAQLRHPGIVRVHNCDRREDGAAYLVMEYLDGTTLRAWVQRQDGPAPLDAALAIGRQLADAMSEVHAKGIVHRDLKPENVLLVPDEAAPLGLQPKILDFGIAKVPPASDERGDTHVQTAAHNFLGTSAYMAPEQCRNAAEVTDRADVYALGVVLFELIAGRPPFVSTDDVELLYHHVHQEPPHLDELVPTVPPALSAFVSSMLAKAPEQRPTMIRCRDMLARSWASERNECPFPGLQPFTEAQAELFFGRHVEINELVPVLEEMREEGARRWLQIEGPSGTGKSSLVQAGLLPRLIERAPGAAPWLVVTLRPSEDPIKSLAAAIASVRAAQEPAGAQAEMEAALRSEGNALAALLSRCVPPGARLLLVVEQLEELFALGGAHVRQVDALLSACLAAERSPLRLLTTLRSDYLHRLEQAPGLARALNSKACRYHLRPMDGEALEQVILGMATRAGLRLSEGLPARMVRDAAGTDARLPLLGHTLRSLWSSRAAGALTHDHYEQIGGVSGALARHAALLLDALGEQGRERAKWLILDLVQVGRGVPDTRRPRTRGDVLAAAGGDRLAEDVLLRISGMPAGESPAASESLRLVVMAADPPAEPSQQRVDLVHETLLQKVPAIVGWIEAERALLERHADLEVAAHAWAQSGRREDGLPWGSLLDHYRGKIAAAGDPGRLLRMASERARTFLGKAEKLERRRLWIRRALILILGAAVVAISATALWAWTERQRAEEERQRAEQERQRAEEERQRAEKNRQHILMATRELVGDLDWKLGRVLYTSSIRAMLLEHLDENLSSLREEEKDEPDVLRAVVDIKLRRSDFARANGRLSESYAFVSQSEDRIRLGLAKDPSSEILRLRLGWTHSKRGKLNLAYGRYELARDDFDRSVAVLSGVRSVEPNNYRRTLATSYAEQGEVQLELGHAPAAAARYEDALGLLEQIDEPDEEGKRYNRSLIAQTLAALGAAARRSGELRVAVRHIEHARELARELFQGEPGNVYFRLILSKTEAALAAARAEGGQAAEALRLYEQAAGTGEALHLGDPTHKEYGLLLCQSLRGVEELAGARGGRTRAAEARARRCEVARGFVERDPEDVRFRRLACP